MNDATKLGARVSAGLAPVLALVLWAAVTTPAQVLGLEAACNVRNHVGSVIDDRSQTATLEEAAQHIESGHYQLVVEHRANVAALLRSFATYLEGVNSGTNPGPAAVYNAYDAAIFGILDSPTASTTTTAGQKAMRTVNEIGRLFAAIPNDILDVSIAEQVWTRTSYTPNEAFASNALRVQLLAGRNIHLLGVTDTAAFAGAVRWNSATDVEFSGYYTNHPGVSGYRALPDVDPPLYSLDPGTTTYYRIDDPVAYTDWLGSDFYPNGSYPIDPETGVPDGVSVGDSLTPAIRDRIRSGIVDSTTGEARRYDVRKDGLPGTHAEVQAANALATGLTGDPTPDPIIGVHTVRSTRGPPCAGFECCQGCTDILRGWARSTGGGGTLPDPYRRR